MRTIVQLFILMLLAGFSVGCKQTGAAAEVKNKTNKVSEQKSNEQKEVARIVFVGQKIACDCTRKRIETTWNALRDVLQAKPKLPVKRIQRDLDVEETKKMAKLKPMMVAPGIYFLDKQNGLVDLLQGEVSKEQIEKIIL